MSYVQLNKHYVSAYGKKAIKGAAGPPPGPFPTDQLISRWTLDDDLDDHYGSVNLDPWGSSPIYVPGKIGDCLQFNTTSGPGKTDNAIIGDIITAGDPHSFSFWVNIENNTNFFNFSVIYSNYTFANTAYGWWSGIPDGALGLYAWPDYNINYIYTSGNLCDGNWHHLVGGHDGSKYFLYVDNAFIGELTATPNKYWDRLFIANVVTNNYSQIAMLDQVYFYHKRLTDSEVNQLWNGGAGI